MRLFETDDVCETSYKDRGAKYQGQRGVYQHRSTSVMRPQPAVHRHITTGEPRPPAPITSAYWVFNVQQSMRI